MIFSTAGCRNICRDMQGVTSRLLHVDGLRSKKNFAPILCGLCLIFDASTIHYLLLF